MGKIKFIAFNIGVSIAAKYSDTSLFNNGWLTLQVDPGEGKQISDRKPPEVFEGLVKAATITKGQSRFGFEVTPKRANIEIEWALQEWQEVEQNRNNALLTCRDYCWPDYKSLVDGNGLRYTERLGVIILVEPQGAAVQSRDGLFYPDGILIRFEEDRSRNY